MFLSVVTVVKNDKKGLKETCESILRQECADYEWLVVDGASTDGSVQFLETISIGRLSWLSEPDGGIYDAMNKAANICRGDYILFLNAGDTLTSDDALERVREKVEGTAGRADAVFCGANFVFPNRKLYRPPRVLEKYIWNGLPAVHQSTVYRTEIVRKHPYDLQYKVCGDYWLAASMSRLELTCVYMDFPFSNFNVGGYSLRNTTKMIREATHIQIHVLGLHWVRVGLSLARRVAAAALFKFLMWTGRAKRQRQKY